MGADAPRPLVLVLGAGPAGLYATRTLTRSDVAVVVINRDFRPGGLAEFGIYHDKHRMKQGLRRQFQDILRDERVTYIGQVEVSERGPVRLDDLDRLLRPDALLVATGAQGTKSLGLPGEEGPFVYHAKDIVYHYNGLPPFSERAYPLRGRVAVVGVGNVMVDIAHYLVQDVQVDEVLVLARRGPGQRAYADKEIRAVAANIDRAALRAEFDRIAPRLRVHGEDPDRILAEMEKPFARPLEGPPSPTIVRFRFLTQPVAVHRDAEGGIEALEVEDTELVARGDRLSARPTGERHRIAIDGLVFAIGDRVDSRLGLPFDGWEYVRCSSVSDEPCADYQAYDPRRGAPLEGVFLAGWARKPSQGLVGTARRDGERAAQCLLADLERRGVRGAAVAPRIRAFLDHLQSIGLRPVGMQDVERLWEVEREEAARRQLADFRLRTRAEMEAAVR